MRIWKENLPVYQKSLVGQLYSRPPFNIISLRTADIFPVIASLPPKYNVCEPEQQNNFHDEKTFTANHSLALKIKELTCETSCKTMRSGYVTKRNWKGDVACVQLPFFLRMTGLWKLFCRSAVAEMSSWLWSIYCCKYLFHAGSGPGL